MSNEIPAHEEEARSEVRKECGRISFKTKEAIYDVLQVYPKARLVRYPLNVYTIETLGQEPGKLATAIRADLAWNRASMAIALGTFDISKV